MNGACLPCQNKLNVSLWINVVVCIYIRWYCFLVCGLNRRIAYIIWNSSVFGSLQLIITEPNSITSSNFWVRVYIIMCNPPHYIYILPVILSFSKLQWYTSVVINFELGSIIGTHWPLQFIGKELLTTLWCTKQIVSEYQNRTWSQYH